MPRKTLLLFLALVSCSPATTPDAPRTTPVPATPAPRQPAAAFAPSGTAARVVLVSFDGLGADALARQMNLPAFDRLAREGASARIINVDPTLTGPSHVSMLTGADPQRTGIVANRFHLPGTPPDQMARALNVDADVETLVEAARRQGKRVGVVPFPSIDNTTPRRTADFGMAWSSALVPSRLITLTRADFKREWVPPTWSQRPLRRQSYSPVMRARIEWSIPRTRIRADVDVVAYDTTNDARENYDSYFVESGDREVGPDAKGWFAISSQQHGSWSKFLRASNNLDVTLYWGPIHRNEAWPESFRAMLDAEAGFWPGVPEEELEVDAGTFLEQTERMAAFYTRVQTLAIARMPFDLLLAYQSQIDVASHQYLGTPEGDRIIRAAYIAADRAVEAIGDALNEDDALVIAGDHGLVPIERDLPIARLLVERGFAPRWRAYISGAHAHLYRSGGADDTDALVNMLTSSKLFERIERKSSTSHRNSGDVMLWAMPDIALDEDGSRGGQHGALNTHRELHPPFFAYGKGVRNGPMGEVRQTKIARFVSALLGINPPAAAE